MNDDELDSHLQLIGRQELPTNAVDALELLGADLSRQAGNATTPRHPARRSHFAWGLGLAAAVLALTAGTTATAYYLGVPPFVTLGRHELRTSEPIPLHYETRNQVEIGCLIYLDFTHTSQAQVDDVDEAIQQRDWSDFGQDLYDAHPELPDAPPLAESLNPQAPIGEDAFVAAYTLADSTIPDLAPRHPHADSGQPFVSGIDMTCRPDAQ
jgi:hypothetical protein